MNSGQKKVISSNNINKAFLPFNSQNEYVCSNADINRGMTSPPLTISECFSRFPSIYSIGQLMGLTTGYSLKGVTGTTFYTFWTGPGTGFTGPAVELGSKLAPHSGITGTTGGPKSSYLHDPSKECQEIYNPTALGRDLGTGWLGCVWGSPEAPFSCICPEIQPKFEAYLKLRLNVATFWNTPKTAPVKRREFLDELNYGRKIEIVIPGDFNLNLGQVVEISVDGSSGYPYDSVNSIVNSKYWIVGIKHVITNSGTHETLLILNKTAETTEWTALPTDDPDNTDSTTSTTTSQTNTGTATS